MRIYLAGPLFSMAERYFNEALCTCLEQAGYEVFLPQRDSALVTLPQEIFLYDRKGVSDSQAVVAIMDGADHDSGTAWECGYAHALRRPVVLVRTDFRQAADDAWGNLMLTQSAEAVVRVLPSSDIKLLAEMVCRELEGL